MKITKTFVSVFVVTFLIGYVSYLFFSLRQDESIFCPVYEINSTTKTKSVAEKPISSIKSDFQPKIFNVEGFWDQQQNQENNYLIETGEVSNGKDFKIKSGETWLGLFGKNDEFFLQAKKIQVHQTDNSDSSWKEISVNVKGKDKPLFMVKNLKKVKAGKVKTLFRGFTWQEVDEGDKEFTSLKNGFSKEFKLGEKKYRLRVEEGVTEKQEPILVLLLENETYSQIIHYIYYAGDGDYVGNLFWVGDLDSDGKLDLFMDFWGYEKGGYTSGLFLSSEAEKGKLVKLFEYFALAGC